MVDGEIHGSNDISRLRTVIHYDRVRMLCTHTHFNADLTPQVLILEQGRIVEFDR
jgi:hypothetical protein